MGHWAASVVAIGVGGVVVLAGYPAVADPSATALFDEGRVLAAAGKRAEACAKFEASFALERAVGTEINLADCRERDGKLGDAWRMFDEAARTDTRPGRARFARDRANALVARTGELVIRVFAPATPGLELTINGRRVASDAEVHDRVEPGAVHVAVSAPERQAFATDVQATAGATTRVDVPPLSSTVTSPPRPKPPVPATTMTTTSTTPSSHTPGDVHDRRRSSYVIASGALAGAGVVALAVSGGLAISARSNYRKAFDGHCVAGASGPVCDDTGFQIVRDAGSRADVATGTAIAGAALVAAGVVVFVLAPRDVERTSVTVAPVAGGWGLSASGRW